MDVLSYLVFFLVVAGIYAVATLGLNLQWGFTGIMNVGVVGFFGVGAYTAAYVTGPNYPDAFGGFGLHPLVGYLAAMVVSGAVAFVVGLPTIRLKHDFLAIGTFGIAICIQLVAMNWKSATRGFDGLHSLPKPFAAAAGSPFAANLAYLVMVVAIILLVTLALERMVRSPWGRMLRAVREDETASAALGKDAFRVRLQTFVMGSGLMGLSGALYANFTGFVSPQDLLPIFTFQVFVMLVVGGSGNNWGAILGAVVIWGLWTATETVLSALLPPGLQQQVAAVRIVMVGLILVAMLLLRPQGLLPERRNVSPEARLKP
ncbi:MAG: branched-chain amino acid ABC transporter permease [Rhodospirillales bacterium]|jgi:branched-chain amino acid transport system permease protein